jgi:hypothetical protein
VAVQEVAVHKGYEGNTLGVVASCALDGEDMHDAEAVVVVVGGFQIQQHETP